MEQSLRAPEDDATHGAPPVAPARRWPAIARLGGPAVGLLLGVGLLGWLLVAYTAIAATVLGVLACGGLLMFGPSRAARPRPVRRVLVFTGVFAGCIGPALLLQYLSGMRQFQPLASEPAGDAATAVAWSSGNDGLRLLVGMRSGRAGGVEVGRRFVSTWWSQTSRHGPVVALWPLASGTPDTLVLDPDRPAAFSTAAGPAPGGIAAAGDRYLATLQEPAPGRPAAADRIVVSDLERHTPVATLNSGGQVTVLGWLAGQDVVVAGFADGAVRFFALPDGGAAQPQSGARSPGPRLPQPAPPRSHRGPVVAIAVAGSGAQTACATAATDGSVVIWRYDGPSRRLVPPGDGDVPGRPAPDGLALSADATLLLLHEQDGGLLMAAPEPLPSDGIGPAMAWLHLPALPHSGTAGNGADSSRVTAAALSRGGMLAVARRGGMIQVAKVSPARGGVALSGGFLVAGHDDVVSWLAFSPDDRYLASLDVSGRLWVTHLTSAGLIYNWPGAALPTGPAPEEATPILLDDPTGSVPSSTIGAFLVVFGADRTAEAAAMEVDRARRAGFEGLTVFQRGGWFRTAARFDTAEEQAAALPKIRALSRYTRTAYARLLTPDWCRAGDLDAAQVQCDVAGAPVPIAAPPVPAPVAGGGNKTAR